MATLTGGEKFELQLAVLARQLRKPATLRVGFLENARYPNGTPVAMIAAIQNYGAPRARIPARPFFSNMIEKKKGEWPSAIAGLLKDNDYDVERTLDLAGEAIEGQLRESIIETNSPPLSPVTLMLRKMKGANPGLVVTRRTVWEAARRVAAGESSAGVSTKPLIWSGDLYRKTGHDVKTS